MSVRFVMGRAGVGKTAHCLDAITASLRESPLAGPRLILLVPEQASLQMERALLDRSLGGAIHRAEVLSFRRLAFRILETCGDGGRSALTPTARAMALRWLASRHASALRYYQRTRRFTGFIEKLGRSVAEFIEQSVRPADLCPPAGGVRDPAGEEEDPVRALKLHDLQLLYGAYLELLGETRLDPSGYLDLARDRLSGCGWLPGALVYVDGFAGFSRQEQVMLVALAGVAERMDLTALVDPAGVSVLDIIETIEGETDTGRCVLEDRPCAGGGLCALHRPWSSAREHLLAELADTPLAGLTIRSPA